MGQFLGAFISACLTFAVYVDAINHVDPNYTVPGFECDPLDKNATCSHTAGIFATYPTGFFPTSTFELLVDQVSFLLVKWSALPDRRLYTAPCGIQRKWPSERRTLLYNISDSYNMSHTFSLDHCHDGVGYVCTGMISAVIKTCPVTRGHFHNWVNSPRLVTCVT